MFILTQIAEQLKADLSQDWLFRCVTCVTEPSALFRNFAIQTVLHEKDFTIVCRNIDRRGNLLRAKLQSCSGYSSNDFR